MELRGLFSFKLEVLLWFVVLKGCCRVLVIAFRMRINTFGLIKGFRVEKTREHETIRCRR